MANPWLAHVKSVRSQNAGMSFKDVLKLAKKSYKKRGGGVASNAATIEVDVPKAQTGGDEEQKGGRRRRRKRRTQRGGSDEDDDAPDPEPRSQGRDPQGFPPFRR